MLSSSPPYLEYILQNLIPSSPTHRKPFTPPSLQQIPRPLLRLKSTLKRFRIRRQTRRNRITLQRIQNRGIFRVLWRHHMERGEDPNKRSVQFSICKMRSCAHARAGAVGVVGGSAAFGVFEIAFDGEGVGFFEVGWVVVGCPGVLWVVS
jgi:hypothetical protein